MDIFENSILCTLEENIVKEESHIPGIAGKFSENDMKLWWNKRVMGNRCTQQNSTEKQERMFDILQGYASDTVPCDSLVNIDALEKLGFDQPLIRLLYQHTCSNNEMKENIKTISQNVGSTKFHNVFMTVFLNSLGAYRPHDLINALAFSVDIKKNKSLDILSKKDISEGKASSDTNIHEIIKKCQRNHITNSSVKNILETKVNEIKKQIEDTIMCKIPNDEIFLSSVAQIIVEPKYATAKFEIATVDFVFYPNIEDHQQKLKMLMKSHTVNLQQQLQTLRKEMFLLILPFSWILPNMDCTVVLDVLLNTMLGCNTSDIRAFLETIEFTFVANLYSSDKIMNNIDEMLANNSLENIQVGNIIECMIKLWKRISAFIIFLGIFRLIFPQNNNITVGKVDHIPPYEMENTGERIIPSNTIYFHKDHFYMVIHNEDKKEFKIKSDTFYELFYQILKVNNNITI